jgi:homoserine/homoserine lactone efflux protein
MNLDTLLLFTATELAMALSPGPAVLLVMSQGARGGPRAAALGAAGIEAGNAIWFLLSALGLTALLLASATAFAVVKWFGAVYLVVLGLRLLTSRSAPPELEAEAMPVAARALVLQGLLTQLANPKAMIFFGALLPQFVDPQGDIALQFAVFFAITVATEYPVLLGYGWLADRGRRLAGGASALRWFDRAAGALLVGAGARMALVARV